MSNNKILFSDNSLFGLLNFRLEVILELKKQGYDIYLMAPNENDFGDLTVPDGLKYIHIPVKRSSFNIFNELRLIFFYIYYYAKINPIIVFHYTIKPNIYGTIIAAIYGINNFPVVAGLGFIFNNNNG